MFDYLLKNNNRPSCVKGNIFLFSFICNLMFGCDFYRGLTFKIVLLGRDERISDAWPYIH